MTRPHAHKMVAEMAKEIARHVYDVSASADNRFYKLFPKSEVFVDLNWNLFIPQARAALQQFHDQPDTPEGTRVQIREAIVKDNLLDGKMADGVTDIGAATMIH